MAIRISNAGAKAGLDAILDLLNASTALGKLRVYTGTQPSGGPDSTATGTLLAQLTFASTAFANSSDIAPGARAVANTITADSSANATGTAGWLRLLDGATLPVMDLNIGSTGSGADVEIDSASITAGASVAMSALSVTFPEST